MGRGKGMSGVKLSKLNISKEELADIGNISEKLTNPDAFDNDVALKKYYDLYVASARAIELLKTIAKMLGNPDDMIARIVQLATQLNTFSDMDENNIAERFLEFRDMATLKILIGISAGFRKLEIDTDNMQWYPDVADGYRLFDFCDASIQSLYNGRSNESVNTVLFELDNVTRRIYDLYMSPNINTDNFAKVITASIGELRKVPELSRYSSSFDVLINCGDMLKDNFGVYYKKFIKTQNTMDIFTNYVNDIAENQARGLDTKTKLGFSKIIRHLTSKSNLMKEIKDPKIKQYFSGMEDLVKTFEESLQMEDGEPECEGAVNEEIQHRVQTSMRNFELLRDQIGK